MHSETPKSRFEISPGMSARCAEEERKSRDVLPRIGTEGGTAARLAEAELGVASRRPMSIRLQARAGVAIPPSSFRGTDAANAQWLQGKESAPAEIAASGPEGKSSGSVIRKHSGQHVAAPDRLPDQAGSVAGGRKDLLLAKSEAENSRTQKSPMQRLRVLFSRKLPKTGTPE